MIIDKFLCCELKVGVQTLADFLLVGSIALIIFGIVFGLTSENGVVLGFRILLPSGVIYLVLSSILILGVRKGRPGLILAYVLCDALAIKAFIIYAIWMQHYYYLFAIPISVYFNLCILSYYLQLKEKITNAAVEDDAQEAEKEQSSV